MAGGRAEDRAGGLQQRTARQREWAGKYDEDNWEVGYLIDGEFVPKPEAPESVYDSSYERLFQQVYVAALGGRL